MSHPMNTIEEAISKILVPLYLGKSFVKRNPNWLAQMKNPVLQEAKAALTALFRKGEVEARFEEARACYTVVNKAIIQARDNSDTNWYEITLGIADRISALQASLKEESE